VINLLEYIEEIHVLFLILVGASCSSSSSNIKILYYQIIMYLIPLEDNLTSWVIKLLMTTGLFVFINKYRLIVKWYKLFISVNFLLVMYYSTYLICYYNNYELMLKLHYSDVDTYLEYIVLLILIDYKGLITNARNFSNKFKYSVLNSYRSISLSYMEVKKDKRWN